LKYDELRNQLTLKAKPWELKIIVHALRAYAADSPEAAEYPEEFWTFKKGLESQLKVVDFMDEIQKPSDTGLMGPMPKIQ
jgi:hypothetical protein